jgi:hypothetical protein
VRGHLPREALVFIRPVFLLFLSLCLFIFRRLFFSVLLCRTPLGEVESALGRNEGRNRRGEKIEKEREEEEEEEGEKEDEEGNRTTLWNRAIWPEFTLAVNGVDAANREAKWEEPRTGALKRENIVAREFLPQ